MLVDFSYHERWIYLFDDLLLSGSWVYFYLWFDELALPSDYHILDMRSDVKFSMYLLIFSNNWYLSCYQDTHYECDLLFSASILFVSICVMNWDRISSIAMKSLENYTLDLLWSSYKFIIIRILLDWINAILTRTKNNRLIEEFIGTSYTWTLYISAILYKNLLNKLFMHFFVFQTTRRF